MNKKRTVIFLKFSVCGEANSIGQNWINSLADADGKKIFLTKKLISMALPGTANSNYSRSVSKKGPAEPALPGIKTRLSGIQRAGKAQGSTTTRCE